MGLSIYKSFNYTEGGIVPHKYEKHLISTRKGLEEFNFKEHSSGPFGKDLRTGWLHNENFFRLIMFLGTGWRDVHASKMISIKKVRNRSIFLIMFWHFILRLYYLLIMRIKYL